MAVNSIHSQSPAENSNNFWLSDSGCNVHMINELTNLILSNHYNGEETIIVENGQPLNIRNIDSGKLSTPSLIFQKYFMLRNLLQIFYLFMNFALIISAFLFLILTGGSSFRIK